MRINLYDIVSSVVGREMTIEGYMEERQAELYGEIFRVVCQIPFSVYLRHVHKDVVTVEFDTVVTTYRTCSRCLDEVVEDVNLHIVRTVDVVKKQAYAENTGEYDEISYIEDCTLDVDMLILDELYTVIPMNVLCKEDCRGICKVCGINLNKSVCDCDQRVPDPRMAVFSDIFNQFKEV